MSTEPRPPLPQRVRSLGRGRVVALVAALAVVVLVLAGVVSALNRPAPTVADPTPVPTAEPMTPAPPSYGDGSEGDGSDSGSDVVPSEPSLDREASRSLKRERKRAAKNAPPGVEASATPGPAPAYTEVTCPSATVNVASAAELETALSSAQPGDVIGLADGVYAGRFTTTASGTAQAPIWLCGRAGAIVDGEGTEKGYGFHLDGASWWRLVGFSVRNAQKGVMADGTTHSVIQGLTVSGTGDEAIHLRRASTDNLVIGNTISSTGHRRDKFGEGVYVGTAQSNWCDISDCGPDRSDRNIVARNRISGTTSENVDIKEGTTGGFLLDNELDGGGVSAADSVVDVKGVAWLVRGNTVANSPQDAFQTHQILDGWGDRNLFTDNRVTSSAAGGGYVVALTPQLSNVASCSNRAPSGMEVSKTGCS